MNTIETRDMNGEKFVRLSDVTHMIKVLLVMKEALVWATEMFHARDEMNAKVHCSPVKWSPVTLRCKQALEGCKSV